MVRRGSKIALLVAVVTLAGCDFEERIKTIVYGDESEAAAALDSQDRLERRTVEPGSSPETAEQLELRRDMAPVRAVFDDADESHWYSLSVDGDEDWIVELGVAPEDDGLDPAVYLEIPGGRDIPPHRYDVAEAGESETIPMLEVPAGQTRRVFVTPAGDSGGGYELDVQRRLSAASVAMEPNDDAQLATRLEVPGEVQGFYDRPHDRDLFFVPAESLRAGIYTLELSAVGTLEQRLRIYGDDRLETAISEISVSENRPAIIPNLSLNADAGDEEGLYFGVTAGEAFARDRGYRLRIIEHPSFEDGEEVQLEREPNDTAGSAQSIDFGEGTRAYLHAADDVDRFRLEIEAPEPKDETEGDSRPDGEVFDPEVDSAPQRVPGDDVGDRPATPGSGEPESAGLWEAVPEKEAPEYVAQIRVRPTSDAHRLALRWLPGEDSGEAPAEVVAEQRDERNGEEEPEELVVCNRVLQPGEYHAEVRSVETESGFRPRSFDYEIGLLNVADTQGMEVEPNDTPETADRLRGDGASTGYIATEGDVDVYAFVVGPDDPGDDSSDGAAPKPGEESEEPESSQRWGGTETESVELHLEGNPLNMAFELMDDQGGRVASSDRQGPGGDEQLQIDLPHGLYYVAVSAASGSECEPYGIEVISD